MKGVMLGGSRKKKKELNVTKVVDGLLIQNW